MWNHYKLVTEIVLIISVSIQFTTLLRAQETEEGSYLNDTLATHADLFEGDDPVEMTMTFDLKKYKREKYKDAYIPVLLSLHVNDTEDIVKEVRIKARGNFRKEYCSFAPYWLNIRKADVRNPGLSEVRKMKIVTHCHSGRDYEEILLKEYLAYRIFNLLTPLSFRVRLLRIRYVDTGRKDRITEAWSFLIEPESMLAERNQAITVKNDSLSMRFMRQEELVLVSLFEYMIGNADYSVMGRQNIKILGTGQYGLEGFTPVPYDFDYSGLVDARYAIPGENLGLSSVRERYYLGPCAEEEMYEEAIGRLTAVREETLELLSEFPYLQEHSKKKMVRYLDSFYSMASSPAFISGTLERTCR